MVSAVNTEPIRAEAGARGAEGESVLVEAVDPADEERPSQSPAALAALAKNGAKQVAIALFLLLAALAVATKLFQAELLGATAWVFDTIGFVGLAGLILLADGFASVIPPDLVLIAIAKSTLSETHRWMFVGILSLVSIAAGNLGYFIAAKLRHSSAPDRLFGRARVKSEKLVRRFGRWAIAVGALTPVPFSITCWAGGLLGMPWRVLAPMTLLRIPRFFVYYAAIDSVDGFVRSFAP
jgi:membrane protein YqaA with SNARE-associated domain